MEKQCELCGSAAPLYCESDDAFLCWACDAAVHGANFLVARHVRRVACGACNAFDVARRVSGAGSRPLHAICRSCDQPPETQPPSPDEPPSPCSSSCLSAAESTTESRPRRQATSKRGRRSFADARAERVLGIWCRRMRLRSGRRCVALAVRVIRSCEGVIDKLPERVVLAAAMWFAVEQSTRKERESELESARTCITTALRRLEVCSGLPARIIVIAELRVVGAAVRRSVA